MQEFLSRAVFFGLAHHPYFSDGGGRAISALLINADYDPLYAQHFLQLTFINHFAGAHKIWRDHGYHPQPLGHPPVDMVILHAPQQSVAADGDMALALRHVKRGGLVVAVAGNQAGGKTLTKRLAAFGCPVQHASKHKCHVVWTITPENANATIIQQKITAAENHPRIVDNLITQAGVFCWDKIDQGTKILLDNLPDTLTGQGADFGCGIGVMGHAVLSRCPAVIHLTSIDHDRRAVDCCAQNLSIFGERADTMWADIPTLPRFSHSLDFIVMNPPFHTGKEEDTSLGKAFITRAAENLKRGGVLYMVANTHLPYESLLQTLFKQIDCIAHTNGFKVLRGIKG